MKRSLRRRRGLYLIELLAVLVVLGAVLLITTQIAITTMTASTQAQRTGNIIDRLDLMIVSLRRDIWTSSSLRTTTPGRLEIETPDGRTIFWQTSAEGLITRTSPGGVVRSWGDLPTISFTINGPLVTMNVARDPSPRPHLEEGPAATAPDLTPRPLAVAPPEQMTFISQFLLAGGAH